MTDSGLSDDEAVIIGRLYLMPPDARRTFLGKLAAVFCLHCGAAGACECRKKDGQADDR